MRVLFDQGTPAPLRHLLEGHAVSTAFELGWATLKNGELLTAAENHGFEVLVTTDTNLKYQQNLASRRIAIVVLGTTSWPRIKTTPELIVRAVDSAIIGSYTELAIP
jgi:hypothetical protein